jgi:hypothetical protein
MFFCGKNINFLLYTLLGRSILVLSVIGLTLFNKYAGIIATIIITTLYNINDYKEGFTGENASKIETPKPTSNTPYGAEAFSSPAEIEKEEDDEEEEEEEEDDEVKDEKAAELTTISQGPPDTSNTLTR